MGKHLVGRLLVVEVGTFLGQLVELGKRLEDKLLEHLVDTFLVVAFLELGHILAVVDMRQVVVLGHMEELDSLAVVDMHLEHLVVDNKPLLYQMK